MDKRNFVYNYVMKKSDFDNLQNDVEMGLNRLSETIAGKGILSGLEVTLSGTTAEISSGIAFDGNGKRIELASSTTVDVSSIIRPAAGMIKWITLVLKHNYREQGSVIDGNNKTWPARILDSYGTEILEGTQAAEASATKPSVSSDKVLLIDIKVDSSTPWASLSTGTDRRPNSLANILNLVYPIGYTYAQYPGCSTPGEMLWPGTWTAQFETEGVFFRTPGGEASVFGSGIQEDAMQRITGRTGKSVQHQGNGHQGRSGVFSSFTEFWTGNRSGGSTAGSYHFDSSGSTSPNPAKTDDKETRPRNRTFRIWKRTA